MNNLFNFCIKTRVSFGRGSRFILTNIIKEEKWHSIGVVVDHNLMNLPMISDLLNNLAQATKEITLGQCIISEPTYDSLEEMREFFNKPDIQAIIGIGGGSALDMAKAMAVLVNNRMNALSYRGFDKMTEPVLPIVAVPTTSGTGSEVTPNASFIDKHEKKKLGINGEAVRPKYAFLDPELTISCPKGPTVSAGVDSMVHAIEAFAAKKTNRIARLFSIEGFNLVFSALPDLVKDLNNLELREKVMFGAFLSGIALMHSGTGPAAAMSYPLSVHFQVPHGLGGGIFLPHVIQHNIEAGYSDYVDLFKHGQVDTNAALGFFSKKIDEVWKKLEIPNNLGLLSIQKKDIPLIVSETMQLKGALDQNPTTFYEKEIEKILNILLAVKN